MQCYNHYKITDVKLLEMVYSSFGCENNWAIFRKTKIKLKRLCKEENGQEMRLTILKIIQNLRLQSNNTEGFLYNLVSVLFCFICVSPLV